MSQHWVLYSVLVSLITVAFLPYGLGWSYEISCYLGCRTKGYYQADTDLIEFKMLDLRDDIESFDMWLSKGRNNNSLTRVASMGSGILLTTWYEFMPANITSGDDYYFEVYEQPGGTGGALGPVSVLAATSSAPTTSSAGGGTVGGYPSYTYPSYTYPSYTYPSYTYPSYKPTSSPSNDLDEYESQLQAVLIGRIVGAVIGSVAGVALVIGVFLYRRRRQRRQLQEEQQIPSTNQQHSFGNNGSPPIVQMMAIPVPAGHEQQQPPQPGYYYANLTPQQPSPTLSPPPPVNYADPRSSGSFTAQPGENPSVTGSVEPPNAFLHGGR